MTYKMIFNESIKELKNKGKKIKGKYPPISEIVNRDVKLLKIKNIYKINDEIPKLYLFHLRNYSNNPKQRYFIVYILASQSSDFIVHLAKELAINNNLRLIQFCLHPKTYRVNLLLLKELKKSEDYSEIIEIFKKINKKFKDKMEGIQKFLENY
ncbi:MAG: hypothetical protein KGD63_06520 [Candidatus Lokiarchaeota archaeon]|nr:hypothetical protein [Candidatus Lokiarchaeota archaeon]